MTVPFVEQSADVVGKAGVDRIVGEGDIYIVPLSFIAHVEDKRPFDIGRVGPGGGKLGGRVPAQEVELLANIVPTDIRQRSPSRQVALRARRRRQQSDAGS